MKLWISRDLDGTLILSNKQPYLPNKCYDFFCFGDDVSIYYLDRNMFSEVTFENSPQEVKIEVIMDSKNKIKITEKILSHIKEKNKHITHFETIPGLNSEWNIDKITSYPNVCNGEQVIELSNEKGEWLRLPLNLVD